MDSRKLIVCVCRGNILRSAVAEKLISQLMSKQGDGVTYQVISRSIQGTKIDHKPVRFPNLTYYNEVYPRVKPLLQKLNVDLSNHVSTPIDYLVVTKASLILAMDNQTKDGLKQLFPFHHHKIYLFTDIIKLNKDIADVPYKTKPTYSLRAVQEIDDVINLGFNQILSIAKGVKY
ncbi:hypothetical protein KBC75_06195 [Candidatus Shapirobacteria bacterium]|nr:hypothetical protein [Candidatus Shapirobacteria bacterium]